MADERQEKPIDLSEIAASEELIARMAEIARVENAANDDSGDDSAS